MTVIEIRTIVAPLTEGYVMLPSTAVAEVLNFTSPKPLKKAPPWLLGELAWQDWQVPIISYERLINAHVSKIAASRARILIIKTLGESTLVNYIGLVIQGLPRLRKVSATTLMEIQTDKLPDVVFSQISIDGLQAVIPRLGSLTRTVEQAAYDR